MKEIKLTRGLVAIVDDEDYQELSRYKWQAEKKKHHVTFYAVRRVQVSSGTSKRVRKRFYMHNGLITVPEGSMIDHENRNGLDNRKCNLRICTVAENNRNQGMRSDSSNKYRGVKYCKTGKKRWIARLRINGKRYQTRRFLTEEEAALAYNELALKHHGEFASLNVL